MARSIRIQFAGAHYHVMARGNRREAIIVDDDDPRFFLHTRSEAVGMTGWRVHAWVLTGIVAANDSIATLAGRAAAQDQCFECGNGGSAANSEEEISELTESIARLGAQEEERE